MEREEKEISHMDNLRYFLQSSSESHFANLIARELKIRGLGFGVEDIHQLSFILIQENINAALLEERYEYAQILQIRKLKLKQN